MSAHLDLLAARVEHISRAMSQETFAFKKNQTLDHRMLEAGCGFIAVTRCVFEGRYFDFADEKCGEMSAVVECLDADAETVVDLAAWPVDRPTEVATLMGRASMLGLHNAVNPASYYFAPLRIYRAATEWLRAGCCGIVVTDMARAAWIFTEHQYGEIEVEDEAHAHELAEAMTNHLALSRVVVPVKLRKAA